MIITFKNEEEREEFEYFTRLCLPYGTARYMPTHDHTYLKYPVSLVTGEEYGTGY